MLPGTAFSHSAIRGSHPVPIISSIDQQFRSKEHKSEWQSGRVEKARIFQGAQSHIQMEEGRA